MTERGILMQAESVRAILAGRKTQTRRRFEPQPLQAGQHHEWTFKDHTYYVPQGRPNDDQLGIWDACPYGVVGSRLWVRETQWLDGGYVATDPAPRLHAGKTAAIFMPRHMSRLTLEITRVRVERVQAISEADAIAEGFPDFEIVPDRAGTIGGTGSHRAARLPIGQFARAWDAINWAKHPWENNPFVWVLDFKVMPQGN